MAARHVLLMDIVHAAITVVLAMVGLVVGLAILAVIKARTGLDPVTRLAGLFAPVTTAANAG